MYSGHNVYALSLCSSRISSPLKYIVTLTLTLAITVTGTSYIYTFLYSCCCFFIIHFVLCFYCVRSVYFIFNDFIFRLNNVGTTFFIQQYFWRNAKYHEKRYLNDTVFSTLVHFSWFVSFYFFPWYLSPFSKRSNWMCFWILYKSDSISTFSMGLCASDMRFGSNKIKTFLNKFYRAKRWSNGRTFHCANFVPDYQTQNVLVCSSLFRYTNLISRQMFSVFHIGKKWY